MKKTTTTYPAYSHKVGFWEGKGYVSRTTTQRRVREVVSILKRKKRKWGYIHIFKRTRHIAPLITMEELKNNRIKRRLHELLSRAATPATSVCNPGQRELHFVFFRKPDRFLESDDQSGRVAGLCKEKTILKEDVGSGKQIAVGTGLFEEMECGLILKSVGYKSVPVDGLPFDHHKGIVPNVGGRVLSEASGDAEVEKGLYVCGWLKRGPTGIVATNLYCAEETVSSFSEDVKRGVVRSRSGLSKHGREGLLQLLDSRNVKIVPFGGWEKIDSEEKRRGGLKNKRREKLTTWQELLEVATK